MRKYTEEDLEDLKRILDEQNGNITKTAVEFCSLRQITYTDTIRRSVSKLLEREKVTNNIGKDKLLDEALLETKGRVLKNSKYYLITWEQNETPLHLELWNNILAYKEFLGAELSVILGRYKNPTSVHTEVKHESWNPLTRPYWDSNRHDIHKYLTILGDVKIQPTASIPLSGLEMMTGETTTIVGHPKQHLKSVPVLEGHPKKILLSTGAITLPNYTDSKSGKKGEFHHNLGFVIVEIRDEDVFFIRQIEANVDGSFTDLCHRVENGKVEKINKISGMVYGDLHWGSTDIDVLVKSMEFTDKMNADVEVYHDVIDGISVNNHIVNNPIEQFKRMQDGADDVMEELESLIEFLDDGRDIQKVIVQANHNDRFDRWILNQDWKKDIKNALTYLELSSSILKGDAKKGVVAHMIEKNFSPQQVFCLDYDDSFVVNGWEVAHHGHIGANGSRGSLEQFTRMSTKMIVGHSHVCGKQGRVLSVGTLTHLREGYNKGASSWLQGNVIIHTDGSVQHMIFIDKEFTTFEI